MKSLAIILGDINEADVIFLYVIESIIKFIYPNGLTCHEVCGRLAKTYPHLTHYRGKFGNPPADHSWLIDKKRKVLIDPYPWCGTRPFIITLEGLLNPWKNLYVGEEDSSN